MSRDTAGGCLDKFRKLNVLHTTYLKYVGLWALDSNSSALSRCLYFIYNKVVLITLFVYSITLLADICMSFDNLSIVTDGGCIFAGTVVVCFRVMIFQFRREKITRLLRKTIDNCCRLCKFPTGGEEEILAKYLLVCRACFYEFSMMGSLLVIAILFFIPLKDGELPIRAWYPFDTTKHPGHGIGYFVEVCSLSVSMTAIIGMESLNINLCSLFLVQLEILNLHFRKCGDRHHVSAVDNARDDLDAGGDSHYAIPFTDKISYEKDNCGLDAIHNSGNNGVFAEQLQRSVRDHQRLLVIMDDFNEVFSASMFVQMLSSTSMICLTGFQVTLVTDQKSNIYKFAIYLVAAIIQLICICWFGNEVIYQSGCLTQSQWLSEWNGELSTKTGRLLILSMIFSRRTLNLKAGVFFVLSMETFIAIMRGSYSFFALLSTMRSEGDQ